MKVPDIPDKFVEGRVVRVVVGTELYSSKHPDDDCWNVKVNRCNLCGACCLDGSPFDVDDEGKCVHLVEFGNTMECSIQRNKPLGCIDDPIDIPSCSITHKKVKAE